MSSGSRTHRWPMFELVQGASQRTKGKLALGARRLATKLVLSLGVPVMAITCIPRVGGGGTHCSSQAHRKLFGYLTHNPQINFFLGCLRQHVLWRTYVCTHQDLAQMAHQGEPEPMPLCHCLCSRCLCLSLLSPRLWPPHQAPGGSSSHC